MTYSRVPADDPSSLRVILADTDALLLDFDGPVCSVFAGFPAPVVAEQLRGVLAGGGHDELPADVQKSEDPFDIFSYAATVGQDEARYIEAALRAHEVEAVAAAEPTAGAHDLVRAWHATGRKLAIVSNNSTAAVETYLHIHHLAPYVHYVSARTKSDPSLLKPDPYLLGHAIASLELKESACVFVGDSVTDIEAAKRANVRSIGFANKNGKASSFERAGADVIVTSIGLLVEFV